jgi:hypothetical protein
VDTGYDLIQVNISFKKEVDKIWFG